MRSRFGTFFQFLLLAVVIVCCIVSVRARPFPVLTAAAPAAFIVHEIGCVTGLIILGGWTVFGLLWRLLRVWKIGQATNSQKRPYGRLPRVSFYLILGMSLSVSRWAHHVLGVLPPAGLATANLLGMFVFLTGLGIAVWARLTLREFWSASEAVIRPGHRVVTVGPYRFVRHPIYTGEILMGLGTGIWAADWLLALLLAGGLGLYNRYRAGTEERMLAEVFGLEYRQYQQTVPMLIPTLRRNGPGTHPEAD